MNEEFTAFMHNGTWSLIYPKPHMDLVAFKWIFRIKISVDGSVERYKACLVASTTEHLTMVRLSALWSFQAGYHSHYTFSCCLSQLDVRHLDVTNAFLHGFIDEDVHMTQPPCFVHPLFS